MQLLTNAPPAQPKGQVPARLYFRIKPPRAFIEAGIDEAVMARAPGHQMIGAIKSDLTLCVRRNLHKVS
jgi:hypothetical protein